MENINNSNPQEKIKGIKEALGVKMRKWFYVI